MSGSEINTHLRALDKQWSCSQFPSVLFTEPTFEFLSPSSPDKSLCKHFKVCSVHGWWGGRARAVAKRPACAKTPIRRNLKRRKSFFFFFFLWLPPQPLIALRGNSPMHKVRSSNSGRRRSPNSASKSSPLHSNPSQRCAHFYHTSCVRATSCQTELHT